MTATEGKAGAERLDPVRHIVTVPLTVEKAFELFTGGASGWWPFETHSVYGADASECVFESREGGRIYERTRDGRDSEWGRIKLWDAPHRFVCSWYPGHAADRGQEVELTFAPVSGGTRVELEHRGWELLGDVAAAARADYDEGWAYVFGQRYADAARGKGAAR